MQEKGRKKDLYLKGGEGRHEVGAGAVARGLGTSGTSPRSGSRTKNPGLRLRRSPDSGQDAGDASGPAVLVVQRILITAKQGHHWERVKKRI